MGAPFRTLCPGVGLEGDKAWLAARASRRWGSPSCSRILGSRRSMTWRASGTDEHTPIFRRVLACYLPSAVSEPSLRIVDDLLIAKMAGCAGEDSATILTAAAPFSQYAMDL